MNEGTTNVSYADQMPEDLKTYILSRPEEEVHGSLDTEKLFKKKKNLYLFICYRKIKCSSHVRVNMRTTKKMLAK